MGILINLFLYQASPPYPESQVYSGDISRHHILAKKTSTHSQHMLICISDFSIRLSISDVLYSI